MYTQNDLADAIAVLSDADLEDNEIDQVDELVIEFAKAKVAIESIMDAEEDGEMGEKEADAAIAQIITDSAEANLDVFDLEVELDEYAAPQNELISFSQALGGTVSNLIEAEYQTPIAGKQAIANATGLDGGQIDQMLIGNLIPDNDTANSIAACFSATQSEEGFKEFMALAGNAMSEVAEFNNSTNAPVEVYQNSSEINQLKAEFSALKEQKELGEVLRVLDRQATDLVSEGYLTPFEKSKLFGEGIDREDGVVLFSSACSANNTAVDTQVDRIKYYLSVASERGQVVQFSQPQINDSYAEVVDEVAETYAKDFINRNGII